MADNNFRAYRSRHAVAQDDIEAGARDAVRDPLAELARLIGQADPVSEFSRSARRDPEPHDDAEPVAPAQNLAAGDGYHEPNQYAEDNDVQPQLAEPYPPPRDNPRYGRDETREPPIDSRYSERVEDFDPARDREPAYDARYRDDNVPAEPRGRPLPALAPQSYDDEYEDDEQWQDDADDQSYEPEEYEDESESGSRRGGMVVILAVLGLAIVGAASAFAYREMFGGTILPLLPPIIKASDGPNKIIPAQAGTSGGADAANANSGEKLVSREEQPGAIQPQNAAPRVVATIPVVPAPAAAPSSNAVAPAPVVAPVAAPAVAPASPPAAAGSTEPKKVHTVLIRPDQSGGTNMAAAAPPAPAARPTAPAPVATRPSPAPAPRPAANAPLALVPAAEGRSAPVQPRTQVARTEAAPAPLASAPAAAPSGGGYSVQVTSQRSEAEAQTAFRALKAKFPKELGSHEPIIRRADLGEKGTYYRAMVGPFASMEAAAGMCSNLKAAGGSCIVQRN
jgi:SPOR domain